MKFQQHYSSSKGNLYTVTANNGKRLMVECGVRWKDIQQALRYDIKSVEACLLTHEHKDHSKSVLDVMQAGIDVYASNGTFAAVGGDLMHRAKIIGDETLVKFNGFQVFSFAVQHDAAEPLGFIVLCDGERLLFATDTYNIQQRFDLPFNVIALECSYNVNVLQGYVDSGEMNEMLAKRLLKSHFEQSACRHYIKHCCDLSRCREIHLLHLSRGNIDKHNVLERFRGEFLQEIIVK